MGIKSRFGRRQRGVAAMEFALTVPLFLAIVGATVYFGLALYTKFLMINAANAAVRACVSKQVGFSKDADFTSCATTEFSSLVSLGGYSTMCGGASITPVAMTQPVSVGALASNVRLLTLGITCNVTISGMVNMASPGGATGNSTVALQIFSAMPYTLNR
jgi:Flp pilus assembly protein TadG